jgi:hypothetical protein
MTSKENLNENLHKPISGIFAKKSVGPHCNALFTIWRKFCKEISRKFLRDKIFVIWEK